MKRSLTVTVVIAILAFFLMAQKAHSYDIAYGTAWQQSFIITGWTPWGFPELEYVELRAVNVIVHLEWFNPDEMCWIPLADTRTNGDGEYYFWHPDVDHGEFRIVIYGNPPSPVFHWQHPQSPELMDYYFWYY